MPHPQNRSPLCPCAPFSPFRLTYHTCTTQLWLPSTPPRVPLGTISTFWAGKCIESRRWREKWWPPKRRRGGENEGSGRGRSRCGCGRMCSRIRGSWHGFSWLVFPPGRSLSDNKRATASCTASRYVYTLVCTCYSVVVLLFTLYGRLKYRWFRRFCSKKRW